MTNKLRALLQDHKSRDPTTSDKELTDHFAEELRNDEVVPNEAILEEVFQLMSEGLEQVCGCVTEKAQATPPRWADERRE